MFMPTLEPDPTIAQKSSDAPTLNLSRRAFLAGTGALVIGLALRGGRVFADSTAGGLTNVEGGDATPSPIEPDGTVKLTCHRSEVDSRMSDAGTSG